MTALDVYLYGAHVADLEFVGPQQYRLRYRDEWLDDDARMPVSLSLPLGAAPITGPKLTSFLDNLLPDNADVRERWAVQAGLATAEPFDLLRVYGADVAGAIQFAPPGVDPNANGSAAPVDDTEIASRIRAIRDDDTSWQDPERQRGYFSLGGAQGKFSLGNTGYGWYEPTGNHPTTHIMKPRVRGQRDGELIEYLTMTIAAATGIPTAAVRLGQFEDEHTLIVERFDRVSIADDPHRMVRLHQEDLAQATGVTRLQKYEYRGGPTYRAVLRLLDEHAPDERRATSKQAFVQALVFSWMVLNTDAHAKNYSVFIRPDGIELTPLYDVSSLIPYVGRVENTAKQLTGAFRDTTLSMRIAADYQAGEQSWFEWESVAREAGLSRSALTEWANAVADALPEIAVSASSALPSHLQTDVVARFTERIPIRAAQIARAIERQSGR